MPIFLRVIILLCLPACLALLRFYYLFFWTLIDHFGLSDCLQVAFLCVWAAWFAFEFMRCRSAACFAVFVSDIFTFASQRR
jgi:hypothetical protein